MPKVTLEGIQDLDDAFKRISNWPNSLKEDALKAMASIAAKRIRSTGEAMGVKDPESSVHILDVIKIKKPEISRSGGYEDITFSGTRTRSGRKTRNAEIAFINEYGKRGQPARPFIGTAMARGEQQITAAGEEIIGDWIEKEWNK